MGAPLAASVNMRPGSDGVGNLRWSDEATFQALSSIKNQAHRYDGASVHLRGVSRDTPRKCYVNPGHSVFKIGDIFIAFCFFLLVMAVIIDF